MTIRPLRRLDTTVRHSLFDRISREALHYAWSRAELDRVEAEHPDLVIERDGAVLAAFGDVLASLAYSYPSEGAFGDLFPSMFEELLPHIREELAADTVRIRLAHGSARPLVEPVLKRLWFTPERPWLSFSLSRERVLPKFGTPKGVQFREGGIDDLAELIRMDRDAFPDLPIPTPVMRTNIEQGERVLLATIKGDVAGMALYRQADPGEGYLHTLAVDTGHRGRGIGAALTLRVAKQLFAEGAERVDLKTDDDNTNAIALYRSLGFRHVGAGRDYRRSTDPAAIAAMAKQAASGAMIRFGGWR